MANLFSLPSDPIERRMMVAGLRLTGKGVCEVKPTPTPRRQSRGETFHEMMKEETRQAMVSVDAKGRGLLGVVYDLADLDEED